MLILWGPDNLVGGGGGACEPITPVLMSIDQLGFVCGKFIYSYHIVRCDPRQIPFLNPAFLNLIIYIVDVSIPPPPPTRPRMRVE